MSKIKARILAKCIGEFFTKVAKIRIKDKVKRIKLGEGKGPFD